MSIVHKLNTITRYPTGHCRHIYLTYMYMYIITINRAWNRRASFRLTRWLKIIPHMIRLYYRCCCMHVNEPVIFSHCVHLKLGHRFHALLKVCTVRDDIVPLNTKCTCTVKVLCKTVINLAFREYQSIIIAIIIIINLSGNENQRFLKSAHCRRNVQF